MNLKLSVSNYLSEVGKLPENSVRLAETSLMLGSISRPRISIQAYQRHLASLARDVEKYLSGIKGSLSVFYKQEALSQVLCKRYGYIGSDHLTETEESANLIWVIDRREGNATALGVLYINTAQLLGWEVTGLDFPERFLIRLEHDGKRLIIDPLSGGEALKVSKIRQILKSSLGNQEELEPKHFREMSHREILVRLQEEIMICYLRKNKIEETLQMIKITMLFAPNILQFISQSKKIQSHSNSLQSSVAFLEKYLDKGIDSENYQLVSSLLNILKKTTHG